MTIPTDAQVEEIRQRHAAAVAMVKKDSPILPWPPSWADVDCLLRAIDAANISLEYRIARLKLRKGDSVVLKFPGHLSSDAQVRVRQRIEEMFPNRNVLLLDGGAELATVREGD